MPQKYQIVQTLLVNDCFSFPDWYGRHKKNKNLKLIMGNIGHPISKSRLAGHQ